MAKAKSCSVYTYTSSKIGNDPYVKFYYTSAETAEVDYNANAPWAFKLSGMKGQINLISLNHGRGCRVILTPQFRSEWVGSMDGWMSIMDADAEWTAFRSANPLAGGADSSSPVFTKNTRDMPFNLHFPSHMNDKPHSIFYVNARIWYWYTGYTGSNIKNASVVASSDGYYGSGSWKMPVMVPASGFGTGGSGSVTYSGTRYTWRWINFKGSWSGVTTGSNSGIYFELVVNGKVVASGCENASSGSLSQKVKFDSPGTYTATIRSVNPYTGTKRELESTTITITYPPPEPPGDLWINNTTATSINTTQRKTLSANWGVGYVGYPADYVLYQVECWSTTKGKIWSTETYATSTSFQWDVPTQHTGCNIYWKMRARNGVGWASWITSGNVEVFWAYNEPKAITAKSLSPRSFQLFDGTTTITFTGESNVNGWGDRPGDKEVEYRLYSGNNILKYYGRTKFNGTGVFSQTMNYSVYETELNKTYTLKAHKMLSGTEYTTSNNPKVPNTGLNHCDVGNITFYEVIGRVSGSFNLEPSVIISGIASNINYSWTYDKQSSEKVTFYLEVYRVSTGQVTKILNLDKDVKVSKTFTATTTHSLIEPQQADEYEIRLKCTVTELLGNTHTYTLQVLKPEVYNPPIVNLALNGVSKPLPTYNFNSYLAKQNTDITYDYNYSYGGVAIVKVILVTTSSFGTEQTNMIFVPGVTPYYNTYTRLSTGDFALGSQVKSYLRVYYQIYGYSRMYDVVSDTLTINITPTRYLYYLTQTSTGERQLNKIHPFVKPKDETSKRIYVSEPL